MATADYIISNQSGASFRTDLNNTLAAIVSNNSNSSEPATKYAYQWWADTSAAVMKIRNSANDGWIELFQLDGTLTLEDGTASAPGLSFRSDLDTGVFRSSSNVLNVTTGGTERVEIDNNAVTITPPLEINTGTNISMDSSASGQLKCISNGYSGGIALDGTAMHLYTNATSRALAFGVNSSEIARFDSNGRFLIGTTTEGAAAADDLTVATSAVTGITIRSGTTSTGNIFFSDGTSGDAELEGFIQYDHDTDHLLFGSNHGTRMVLHETGKLTLGTTSTPVTTLFVSGQIGCDDNTDTSMDSSASGQLQVGGNGYSAAIALDGTAVNFYTNATSRGIIFGINETEECRITSGGNFLVGKSVSNAQGIGVEIRSNQIIIGKTASGAVNGIFFTHNSTYCGGLNYDDSSTSLATSSDERLKENIKDSNDAANKIDAIKVRQFDWKSNGKHQEYGFVAQELEPVFAHAVHTGEDDFKTKTVDYACFVPLLVKELQSLRSRVAVLEAA
jgi:hypothetical protein